MYYGIFLSLYLLVVGTFLLAWNVGDWRSRMPGLVVAVAAAVLLRCAGCWHPLSPSTPSRSGLPMPTNPAPSLRMTA